MTCIYNIHIYYICNIHIIYVGQRGLAKSGLTMAHPTILYDASLFLLLSFGSSQLRCRTLDQIVAPWLKDFGVSDVLWQFVSFEKVLYCNSLCPCPWVPRTWHLSLRSRGFASSLAWALSHGWAACRMASFHLVQATVCWDLICFLSCVSWVCFWPCVQAFWHLLTCEHWYMLVQQVGCNHAEMYWVWLRWLLS